MLIKKKIIFLVSLFFLIFTINIVLLFYVNVRLRKIRAERLIINQNIHLLFQNTIFSKELFIKDDSNVFGKWASNYNELIKKLHFMFENFDRKEEMTEKLYNQMNRKQLKLYNIFVSIKISNVSDEILKSQLAEINLLALDMLNIMEEYKGYVISLELTEMNRYNYAMIIISVMLFIMVSILIIIAYQNIFHPLKIILNDIKTIDKGDLTHNARICYADELGEVSASFNKMKNNLAKAYNSLEEHKNNLEREVEEKVKDIRQANELLSNQKETFSSVLNGIDDVIYVSDPDTYELLHVNKITESLWGKNIIGQKCYKILQNREEPCPFCTNDIIFGEKLGRTHFWEFQNEVNKHWFRCADKAIPWINGKMVRFELASDISDIKEIQFKLEESNEQLERFAYVASHDLQEPLRKVSSFTELFCKRYNNLVDEKGEKYMGYIIDGTKRMQKLINDLLTFSRINTRGNEFIETDINKILDDVMDIYELKIREENAEIIYEKMPIIKADESQIRQLFQNLVGNALKFRRKDISPKIRIWFEENAREWIFYVKDNGIGIEEQYSDRIFIIFQRLHNRNEYEGTGIGLALCKQIVRRHNGEILFESTLNEGTTFIFSIKK